MLLVEDQAVIALEFEGLLTEFGCAVVGPFLRVAAALEAARSEPLDGAVLDINLAGEQSFPVAEQLQARRIPFFFVTGLSRSILPAGLQDVSVLAKPVRPRAFAALVERLFLARGGSEEII